jgi:hypothetical protein
MTTGIAAILLLAALALIVSATLIATRRRTETQLTHESAGTGVPESHLLRRPLRSHYGV